MATAIARPKERERERRGGDIAILIRFDIQYKICNITFNYNNQIEFCLKFVR